MYNISENRWENKYFITEQNKYGIFGFDFV